MKIFHTFLMQMAFYMERYSYKESMEYLHDFYSYGDMMDNNEEQNNEPASKQVFNIDIEDNSHDNNTSIFITRIENNRPKPFPCQTQGRGFGQCHPNFLITSQRQPIYRQHARTQGRGEKTWIPLEIWKQLLPETHKFLLLSIDEQKTIMNKHDSLINRK